MPNFKPDPCLFPRFMRTFADSVHEDLFLPVREANTLLVLLKR